MKQRLRIVAVGLAVLAAMFVYSTRQLAQQPAQKHGLIGGQLGGGFVPPTRMGAQITGGSGTGNRVVKFTGPATIGNSSITDDGTRTTFTKNSGSTALTPSTHMMELTNNSDVFIGFRGTDVNAKGLIFANSLNANDGGIYYDTPGFARGMQLRTGGNANRVAININGKVFMGDTASTAVDNDNDVLTLGNTGAMTATTALINGSASATFTPSVGVSLTGVKMYLTSSRSGGAGTLTNLASDFSATSADANIALRTVSGDVLLNNTSGTTGIAVAASTSRTLNVQSSPSGGTAGFTTGYFNSIGTYDTTAGAITTTGLRGFANATRSAGANDLTNIGGFFNAGGGQFNYALWTDNGDVRLNAASGTTSIGTSATQGRLNVYGDGSSTAIGSHDQGASVRFANTNGTTGNFYSLVFGGTARASIEIKNVDTSNNYADFYFAARAADGYLARHRIASTGDSYFGDTGAGSTSTSVANNIDVMTIGNSGTGQTGADKSVLVVTHSGSLDTTGSALTSYGLVVTHTASRSAGANNLTNNAAKFSASGGQVNRALITDLGDVLLNVIGGVTQTFGNTTLGDANTDISTTWGHTISRGTAPSLGSCGTTPTIDSGASDQAGFFTTGTGGTTCTITFSRTYTVEPACVIQPRGAATIPTCTVSATAITCTTTLAATKYHYICLCSGSSCT